MIFTADKLINWLILFCCKKKYYGRGYCTHMHALALQHAYSKNENKKSTVFILGM
jgi:RimJ/RimL family protein N-acetyltransferase